MGLGFTSSCERKAGAPKRAMKLAQHVTICRPTWFGLGLGLGLGLGIRLGLGIGLRLGLGLGLGLG